MKLVSCHIKNFGNLTNRDYDFSNGINSFIEKNGTGKSTLAAFIKAMLYGMDSTKTNDKDFKERKHYAPFNEQSYGGSLIFRHNNKKYKIEKTFDLKSSAKDEIKIYEDDELTNRRTDIGEETLGLDKDSFERLIFISEKDIQMTSNGNIKKNLNNIIADTTEGVDFDSVKERLSELEKKYGNGKNGLKTELNNAKNELEEKIINQEKVSKALSEKYQKRNELDTKLKDLQEKQRISSSKKEKLAFWENYKSKINNIKNKNEELNELNEKYPKGMPNKQEIFELEDLFKKRNQIIGQIKGNNFEKEKIERLEELKNKFLSGTPTPEEMEELYSYLEELKKNNAIIEHNSFPEKDKILLEKLKSEFKDGLPSDNEVSQIQTKINEYKETNTILLTNVMDTSKEDEDLIQKFSTKNTEEVSKQVDDLFKQYTKLENENENADGTIIKSGNKSSNKRFNILIALLVVSIIVMGSGIGFIFKILALGVALTILGLMGVFCCAFFYLKKKVENTQKENLNNRDNEINNKKNELVEICNRMNEILKDYDIQTGSIYSDVERFNSELKSYKSLVEKQEKYKEKKAQTEKYLRELKEEISAFLSKYLEITDICADFDKIKNDISKFKGLDDNYSKFEKEIRGKREYALNLQDDITKIVQKYDVQLNNSYSFEEFKTDIDDYNRLKNEYETYTKISSETNKSKNDLENKIESIDIKYSLGIVKNGRDLSTINHEISKINELKEEIYSYVKEAEEYKQEKQLTDGEEISENDVLDYTDDIDKATRELATIDGEIDSDEQQIYNLEDNKCAFEETKKEIEINNHKLDIIKETEKIFIDSQKELDKKYVSPIMDKFKHYSNLLKNSIGANIEMGRDFNITLNVNGETKSDGHLSSGQRSVCALCFRLALLDNIYNDNVPFIIMDDPFVMLDDENIRASIDLIKELSKKEQIIYFSCHESRKI